MARTLEELLWAAYELRDNPGAGNRICPRGRVFAILTDYNHSPIGTGRNLLPIGEGPCTCNDGVDTLKGGSKTCQAEHAEMAALRWAAQNGNQGLERILITTRPPCGRCLWTLKNRSNVAVIVTSDEYPDRDNSELLWAGDWIVLPRPS